LPAPPAAVLESWLASIAVHVREARRPQEKGRPTSRLDGGYVFFG